MYRFAPNPTDGETSQVTRRGALESPVGHTSMDSSSLAVKAVKRIDFYIDSLTTVRTSLQKVVDPPVKNPNDVHTSNHCNELHSCTEFFSEVC